MAAPAPFMAGLPAVIAGELLEILIATGTHDSLHSIVDIMVNGALGAVTRANMRAMFTAAAQARIRNVYCSGHFPNQGAAAAVMAANPFGNPAPPPRNPGEIILICQCVPCFHFLRRLGILSPEGFSHGIHSYLSICTRAPPNAHTRQIALYIVQNMPGPSLVAPQMWFMGGWPVRFGCFGSLVPYEEAFKAYIARLKAWFAMVGIPGANFALYLVPGDYTALAPWIDPDTADDLLAWNLDCSRGFRLGLGTMFHMVLRFRNPHRHRMLVWLHNNAPIMAGPININYVTSTSLNPAGGVGWVWPPLATALYLGDTRAVHVLRRLPGVNFLNNFVIGAGPFAPPPPAGGAAPGPGPGMAPFTTIGVAAAYGLTWESFDAFKIWFLVAAPVMAAAGANNQIRAILRAVLSSCSDKRAAIKAEPLPAGTLISVHRRDKARRRQRLLDVAISFIFTIQETYAHTNHIEPDGTLRVQKMYETPWYRTWVRNLRIANRNPATRFRDVVPLFAVLDRGHQRIHRSGRDFADPMDLSM